MIPLLLDQGLPAGAARRLRDRGWDVVHVSERGLSRAPDAELLALAAREGRVMVTLDADFPMLMALERRERPSVIHVREQHVDLQRCDALLAACLPRLLADLTAGCVASVRHDDVRVRMLPIDRSALVPGVAEKQAGRLRAPPGFDPADLDEAQRLRAAYDACQGGDRESSPPEPPTRRQST